jgi:ArsR family transcriptional regulator
MEERFDCKGLSTFFKALSNPIRLKILKELTVGEKCVSDVENGVHASQATVSQHLAVLKECGIVTCRKAGNMRCYRLKQPELIGHIIELAEKTEREDEK